jgi:hypothetical protein
MPKYLAVLTIALLMAPRPASADTFATVDFTFAGALGDVLQFSNPISGGVYAGPYAYEITNLTADPSHPGFTLPGSSVPAGSKIGGSAYNYLGFCIDFNDHISAGDTSTNFKVQDLKTAIGGNAGTALKIEELVTEYAGPPTNGSVTLPVKGTDSDALSLAIWESLVGQNNQVYTSGSHPNDLVVTNNAAAVTEANTWLTNASSHAPSSDLHIYGLAGSDKQGVLQTQSIMFMFSSPHIETPEPASVVAMGSMCLLGIPLACVVLRSKRRKRVAG